MPSAAEKVSQLLQQRQAAEEQAGARETAARVERQKSEQERHQVGVSRSRLLESRVDFVLRDLGVPEELAGLKTILEENGAEVSGGFNGLTWTYGEIYRGHHSFSLGTSPDAQRYYRFEVGVVFRGDDSGEWANSVRSNARKSGILGITGKVREDAIFVVGGNEETSFIRIQGIEFRESLSSALAQAYMNPREYIMRQYTSLLFQGDIVSLILNDG